MNQFRPLSASELKLYRSLLKKKYRVQHGLFLAEGERTVSQLLEHGHLDAVSVIIREDLEDTFSGRFSDAAGISFRTVSKKILAEFSDTQTPQGITGVFRIPESLPAEKLELQPGAFAIALDGLSDPGNLGTVYRTAAWFGASAVICGEGTADLYNPKTVRSTAGATGSIPVCDANLPQALNHLEQKGYEIRLLDLTENAVPVSDIPASLGRRPAVFVLGNEAHGIQSGLRDRYPAVYIPGNPKHVESLNAAVSAGILMSRMSESN